MNNKNFNPGEEFEKQLRQELEKEIFPNDKIGQLFSDNFPTITRIKSPKDVGCDLETFRSIYLGGTWNFYVISFAINALESMSAEELGLETPKYLELITATREMADYWNSSVEPIKTKIQSSIKMKMALDTPKVGKFVNPNFRKR